MGPLRMAGAGEAFPEIASLRPAPDGARKSAGHGEHRTTGKRPGKCFLSSITTHGSMEDAFKLGCSRYATAFIHSISYGNAHAGSSLWVVFL